MIFCAALTKRGADTAKLISERLDRPTRLFLPSKLDLSLPGACRFRHTRDFFELAFREKAAMCCVMACGIVVRGIKDYLKDKTKDPPVVVVDEAGQFAISLISGHLGGANALARQVADILGARAVITTATDVNDLPAFDDLARELSLEISSMKALKSIHMALLDRKTVSILDPLGIIRRSLPERHIALLNLIERLEECSTHYLVIVDKKEHDISRALSARTCLLLRPRRLYFIGVGCNRGTTSREILSFLYDTLNLFKVERRLIGGIATIDAKRDEQGLIEAADALHSPLIFFPGEELKAVSVPNPSPAPQRALGTSSVAEAASILAAGRGGRLVVEKQKKGNCTIAISEKRFL